MSEECCNNTSNVTKPCCDSEPVVPQMNGRAVVYSDYEVIDAENVVDALTKAIPAYSVNVTQISYLWRYYKGVQPILNRKKQVRPQINNKIVENHAQEIVAFKIGYQLAEPLQYTCRKQSDENSEDDYENTLSHVNELNTLMFAEDKASCDRDLFEWMCVCGIGFRMVEVDTEDDVEEGSAPYEIYTLDPRQTCVVRSSNYRHKPLMAFWVGKNAISTELVYYVYTDKMFFKIENGQIVDSKPHTYGHIPIIEYQLNNARMGVFEPVLPLLDAINAIESNRLDDIEQTVQSLLKFINCDIDEVTFQAMLDLGAVKVKSSDPTVKSDIDAININLDQNGSQVTKEDLYQAVVNICGMPNRNGQGGSTSDTGAAVLLRDGWTLAESHAKSYELQFKRAERDFLRVVLSICSQSKDCDLDLRIRDIELTFNRRNYENILVKSQVLTTMLATNKIHPELAFQSCGLFTDPEAAYRISADYEQQRQEEFEQKQLEKVNQEMAFDQAEKIGSQANSPEPNGGNNGE